MFKFFKKKEKPAKTITFTPEPLPPDPPKPKVKRYSFKVAGISFHEDDIRDQLLFENEDYNMSKKDLIDMGMTDMMIYQFDGLSTNVQLIPEPDNPHDPDAIKVITDGIHIGYVPSKETGTIRDLLSANGLMIGCSFHGGEYKIITEDLDTGKYKLEKGKNNIGAVVTLKYEQ